MNWLELFTATDHFLLTLAQQYGAWIYATLFAIFFCETGVVFLAFLPGDSLLFVAGAVAAGGAMDVTTVMATVLAGAIAGNTVNYLLGAWFGRRIYDGTIGWIDQAYLRKTHDFYQRHGGKTVVLARFIPVVRTFAPLVAGAGGMDLRRFGVGCFARRRRLFIRQSAARARQRRLHSHRRTGGRDWAARARRRVAICAQQK